MRRPPFSTLVTALILALLSVLAASLLRLQTAPPQWVQTGFDRKLIAAAILLVYVALCMRLLRRRTPVVRGDSQGLLVVHASQTGMAQDLAERTAAVLAKAGLPVRVMALGELEASTLAQARRALFLVSTTGEGDAPDSAYAFIRRVLPISLDCSQLQFGLLALGDRRYSQYCGFGRRLDEWLQKNGARPLFDRVEVDDSAATDLARWQQGLSQMTGATEATDWTAPRYQHWQLTERRLGNPGSPGEPVFHLAFTPPLGSSVSWQAGDIAEIVIRSEQANASQPPPHREYSIASMPSDGRVELLLRQRRSADGKLGTATAWLTQQLPIGSDVELRLRSNENFRAPTGDAPMILIGNGTGIAGLRAHLKARVAVGSHRNWLLFGERSRRCDDHYRDELETWQTAGFIERLDRVFSRDAGGGVYVQHRLLEAADDLRRWLDDGAYVYVCGSAQGMAPAVDRVLREVLGDAGFEAFATSGRYRRDVY